MDLQRMSPRVVPEGAARVPVFPGGRSPRPLAWVVVASAVLPAALAILDDRAGFRLVMAALALTLIVTGLGVDSMFRSIQAGLVRIDAASPGLRFAPTPAATLPIPLIACALLLPAVAQLAADTQGLPTMSGSRLLTWAPYALGVLGLAILVVTAARARTPAGLELSARGLRGIRGVAPIDWSWDDLAAASVVAGPAAKLSLVSRDGPGRPVLAPARALGSDPNPVAAVVQFYLDHPGERVALDAGGVEAVHRVEAAQRERSA